MISKLGGSRKEYAIADDFLEHQHSGICQAAPRFGDHPPEFHCRFDPLLNTKTAKSKATYSHHILA
uniref:Uncharacterized protein n=1 Tax=Candidatus Kentrum sp. FW TaxID=2126338 RepID=A0A450T9I6_9GAMM|nr:MAG: hypothetical protein BECKFW1821B_GA0114236_10823 [Candidatus Kentron sp. FW]